MYKAGTYVVTWETKNLQFHRSPIIESEQAARDFGNKLWRNPEVYHIEISRSQFYHHRRRSVTIAKATKAERQ